MKTKTKAALAAALTAVAFHSKVTADVVTDWNFTTIKATKGLLTPTQAALNTNLASRIDAIESIAVHDAVNAVLQTGTPYHYNTPAAAPASAAAAAAKAARDVLANYFPAQTAVFDAQLAADLAVIPDGPEETNGVAAGAAAAADIIALRAADGSGPNQTYAGSNGVGEWRPTPAAFAPGINQQWAGVTPFLLTSQSQFRAPVPPPVGSPAYKKALKEVERVGDSDGKWQTPGQKLLADFYKQDAEVLANEAVRLLSASHSLTVDESARLFVLLNIALADARIAIWESKYHYKYWRPVTALNADRSGAVTNDHADWSPYLPTPPHPSYPSGHSGTVNAGFEVLRSYFGDYNTLTLHFAADATGATRTITSFTQGEAENGLSRIYGGIHYSFDNEEGQKIGNAVAEWVLAHGPKTNP